jgi:membrane protein DedA with SNARE-associated domain
MLENLGSIIINIISSTGYLGVFLLMTVESALIPMPSEITMPFAGSLVALGKFNLIGVTLSGTLGNLIGSLMAYGLGFWGQEHVVQNIIKNYGRYLLITLDDYERAKKYFNRYGEKIVFISRLMPVIRTYISLPAGIARMNISKFILYTIIGSFLWSLLLAYIGMILGQNWQTLGGYFHKLDLLIAVILVGLVSLYIRHKIKKF